MKCHPSDGFIGSETTIYCNGKPLDDIKTIYIRPKYDSLPDIHKNWSSEQIKRYYLYSNIYGRYRYYDGDNRMNLKVHKDGNKVSFMVYGMEPNQGLITCSTTIHSNPIKSAEILHIEQQRDAAFAARLQQREYEHIFGGRDQMMIFRAMQQIEMNPNQNMAEHPLFVAQPFVSFAHLQELQRMERNKNEPIGLNQHLINTLPTYKYSIKTKDGSPSTTNKEEDHISCRICLEDYEDDDELKILPCFHQYHRMCIDHWFKHSVKCPICTNSVFD